MLLLAALAAAGLGLGIVRLISGLGTTTALSDGYPWGLWIVYDVFFVPFSAGAHQTASCDGCHVTDGQAPASECAACHNAPESHLEGACDRCHSPEGWVGSAAHIVSMAVKIPHDLDGKDDCLMCHDPEGNIRPALPTHKYQNEQCTVCHKPEP